VTSSVTKIAFAWVMLLGPSNVVAVSNRPMMQWAVAAVTGGVAARPDSNGRKRRTSSRSTMILAVQR